MSNKDNKTVSKMDEKAALRESFNKILPSDDDDNSRDLEKKSKKIFKKTDQFLYPYRDWHWLLRFKDSEGEDHPT